MDTAQTAASTEPAILAVLFWIICIGCIISFFVPLSLNGKIARRLTFIPLFLLFLYVFYEVFMPVETNIRVDLLLLYPLLGLSILLFFIRIILLAKRLTIEERAARANPAAFREILDRVPDFPPVPGDEK